VERLDTGISEADKGLKETVNRLQKKFKPKSSLFRRTIGETHANDTGTSS
jgi:hypothetical protein